jgi:redox-sensitive bicupin YhaK (pirin superfamily)
MPDATVLSVTPLSFPWQTPDPFLFCVYHDDAYPAGNADLGPAASLRGRDLGQDFAGLDGWRMYHGSRVPGFPAHPHRGFETVTIVRRGLIDHSDSLGATARYGAGDVQWLTAGRGIVHCEMFPLVHRERENPLELFQIWLNLPRADKMAEPHFAMLWNEAVPRHVEPGVEITVVAGDVGGTRALAPPPRSWAARPEAGVVIWTVRLAPGARWTLPAVAADANRTLYAFRGAGLRAGGRELPVRHAAALAPAAVAVENGDAESELLVLGGRPIGEPVVQHGPFVMTSRAEILQAFDDYRRTRFGGWPWASDEPVHARDAGRFARRPDGSVEVAGDGAPSA